MRQTQLRAVLLMGPTASGKTDVALELAKRFPIEIVSVDSALIYQNMNIGTAKPSDAERSSCPHHLIDIISPEETYSAARFANEARVLIKDICQRGSLPVLTGGTMLYFKALHDGLSDLPQSDAGLRKEIEEQAHLQGWPALHAELSKLDANAAARLNPNDAQRIQRALEIVRLSGKPLADNYKQLSTSQESDVSYLRIALEPSDRSVLHERIGQRFDLMLRLGFEQEVIALRNTYKLEANQASMRCVGYRQMWEFLEGEVDFAEMRFKSIAATRQLAKRQITWLRQFKQNWPNIREIDSLALNSLQQASAMVESWLCTDAQTHKNV